MKSMLRFGLFAFIGLLSLHGAERTWTGSAGDGVWSTAANWSGGVPGSGDEAIFPAGGAVSVTLSGNTTVRLIRNRVPLTITVPSGVVLELSNLGTEIFTAYEDAVIDGEGSVKISTDGGTNYADWRPQSGKTLTVNARIIANGDAGIENNAAGTLVLTNPDNEFTGGVIITSAYGQIHFANEGAFGKAPFLQNNKIYSAFTYTGGDATLDCEIRHAVDSSDTGRDISFYHLGHGTLTFNGGIDNTTNLGKALTFNMEHDDAAVVIKGDVKNSQNNLYLYTRGRGRLTVDGDITIKGNVVAHDYSTIVLNGDCSGTTGYMQSSAGSAIIMGAGGQGAASSAFTLSDAVAVTTDRQRPGGRVVLNAGVETSTGTLSVGKGGTLDVVSSAIVAHSEIKAYSSVGAINTTRLRFNSSGTAEEYLFVIPTMIVSAGDGVVVLQAEPAASGSGDIMIGTLNLTTSGTGRLEILAPNAGSSGNSILVGNFGQGALPANITINGMPATYDSVKGVIPLVPSMPEPPAAVVSIPALGLMEIESTADTALVDSAGSGGGLTLGESLTSLGALLQDWGSDAAEVDQDGNTLVSPLIGITANGGNLTLAGGVVSAPGLPPDGYPPINHPRIVYLTGDVSAGIDSSSGRVFTHLMDFGNANDPATINGLAFININGVQSGTVTGTDGLSYGFTDMPPTYNGNNWNNWTNDLPTATSRGLLDLMHDMAYTGSSFNFKLTGLTPGATYELRIFNRAWDSMPSTTQRTQKLTFAADGSDVNPPSIAYDQNNMPANMVVVRYVPDANGTLQVTSKTLSSTSNPYQGLYGLSNEKISDSAVGVASGTRLAALTFDNQSSSSVLKVESAVVDNGGQLGVVKSGVGSVELENFQSSGDITVLQGRLALGVAEGENLQIANAVNGGQDTTLVKSGKGKMTLAAPIGFAGTLEVAGGTLEVTSLGAVGSSEAPLVVKPGGSLAVHGTTLAAKPIYLEGSGAGDGKGAFYNAGGRSIGNAMLANVTLTGDVVIGGGWPGQYADIRYGVVDFNGYSITKISEDQLHFGLMYATNVTETTSIDLQAGAIVLAEATDMGGSAANVLTIHDGAFLGSYGNIYPFAWTIKVPAGEKGFMHAQNNTGMDYNRYTGPINLGDNSTLVFTNGGGSASYYGPISGNGSLLRATGSSNETYLFATNTYTGTTEIYGGGVHARGPWALSGYNQADRVINRSWLYAYTKGAGNPEGWEVDDLKALYDNADFSGTSTLVWRLYEDIDYPYDIEVDTRLRVQERYTANLLGEFKYEDKGDNGGLRVGAGATVNLLSEQESGYLGWVDVDNGVLNITNQPATVYTSASAYDMNIANGGVINLANGNTLVSEMRPGYDTGAGKALVNTAGKGTLNISSGATWMGKLNIGNRNEAGDSMAVYVDGGTLLNTAGRGNDGRIGLTGHGYVELNSGTFTNRGYTQLGVGVSAVGVMRQNGGLFAMSGGKPPDEDPESNYLDGGFAISRGGTGMVHIAGGEFIVHPNNKWGTKIYICDGAGEGQGMGVFMIEGGAAKTGWFDMCGRNGTTGVANLNGGELNAAYFWKSGTSGSTAILNLNGTRWQPTRAYGRYDMIRGTLQAPTANVWSGGAHFHVLADEYYNVGAPLVTPAGNGVHQMQLSGQGSGYIAPPYVHIIGGGGVGATAVASIDRASGKVVDVKITSPGTGYTSVPTVSLSGGGGSGASVTGVRIGPNPKDGGLVKSGDGHIVLAASGNTFQGVVEVSGGALDLNGGTLNNASVKLSGSGAVVNGEIVAARVVKSGSERATLAAGVTMLDSEAYKALIKPGLYETQVTGASGLAITTPHVSDNVESRGAYQTTQKIGDNTMWVYRGYIWNHRGTSQMWTFGESFDDQVYLALDDEEILNNGNWNVTTFKTVEVTPGPHKIEIRVYNGTGGSGPQSVDDWGTTAFGVGVDFQGRGSKSSANYIPLLNTEELLFLTTESYGVESFEATGAVEVEAGTLVLSGAQPGLLEGELTGTTGIDKTTPNPATAVRLDARMANQTIGGNTTWIYSGYIWNRSDQSVTWSFAESFDDQVYLVIGGQTVLNDVASGAYKNTTVGTITLAPGAHSFELRVFNGTGGSGPYIIDDWTNSQMGVGIDFQGRGSYSSDDYQIIADPGDGSLFTTSLAEAPDARSGLVVSVASGATLDMGGVEREGVTVRGAGLVENAVFGDMAAISPAGDSAIGSMTLGSVSFKSGATYRVTTSGKTQSDLVVLQSAVDLGNLTIVPSNELSENPEGTNYLIMYSENGFTGGKPSISGFGDKWNIIRKGKELYLTSQVGTVLLLR